MLFEPPFEDTFDAIARFLHRMERNRGKAVEDDGKTKQKFTLASQIRNTLLNSWLNLLFAFVPTGFAVYYTGQDPRTTFAINFVAIIPSSAMLAFAIDEITMRFGEVAGALLSMTFR